MTVVAETRSITISQPSILESEIEAVAAVLRSGQLAQGAAVAEFEAAFAEYVGTEYAIATSSGTTALHLALLAHGIGPGDEVITTPFTFIATANAVLFTGAVPIFADVEPDTLNVSPDSVLAAITPRTRAILPVHLYGNPCCLDALGEIAAAHRLALIEDACQAHGAEFQGQRVGSLGTGCFSFYPTKNMTSGEGGMITTSDPEIADRIRLLRNHGQRQRYLHEQVGFNARMTDIQAALGLAQLGRLDERNARRAENAAFYDAHLTGIRRPTVRPGSRSAWHQYTLFVGAGRRDRVVERLHDRGIGTGVYYPIPVHRQPAYHSLAATTVCPVAETASAEVLSIPVHPDLSDEDRAYIAAEVQDAFSAS